MTRWREIPWKRLQTSWPLVGTVVVTSVVFLCGLLWRHAGLLGLGAALLCLLLRRAGSPGSERPAAPNKQRSRTAAHRLNTAHDSESAETSHTEDFAGASPERASLDRPVLAAAEGTDSLVDELLAAGRYALLLRPETKQHLSQTQIMSAIRALDEAMALVPAGRVLLGQLAEQSSSACGTIDVDPRLAERNLVDVDAAYLDRYCVTNEEYQEFVDAGGYEQLEFWHEEALPALLDFVDQTGTPGPRYWSDGRFPPGDARLPVVGVSWYEAWAYARWVGKRLPSDALWTKSGAWPVEAAPGRIAQRRYPWGESFDIRRAHVYGSGGLHPVTVDEYPGGVSVGGIHQLIGNVWEWTATPLAELADRTLHVSESIMSIRGGAYDTYFENQATCHYQSGEHLLSRRPNIGFRLALAMSDLETENHSGGDADSQLTAEPEAEELQTVG